jgi:hypothetical protein
MAEIIKKIPVKNKEEAIRVTDALTEKYQLVLTDPNNSLDASNPQLHVFYDAETKLVVVETNDAHSTEAYIKELLVDFPTFF